MAKNLRRVTAVPIVAGRLTLLPAAAAATAAATATVLTLMTLPSSTDPHPRHDHVQSLCHFFCRWRSGVFWGNHSLSFGTEANK